MSPPSLQEQQNGGGGHSDRNSNSSSQIALLSRFAQTNSFTKKAEYDDGISDLHCSLPSRNSTMLRSCRTSAGVTADNGTAASAANRGLDNQASGVKKSDDFRSKIWIVTLFLSQISAENS